MGGEGGFVGLVSRFAKLRAEGSGSSVEEDMRVF